MTSHSLPGAARPSSDNDELSMLLSVSASQLCGQSDSRVFLDWFVGAAPLLAPALVGQINEPRAPALRQLGAGIYNATPLPEHDFRRLKVPAPGRNDPCSCGSGRKFKHCCHGVQVPPVFDDYNMLRHVLDHLPRKAYTKLPGSAVDPAAVADTAMQWQAEGDLKPVVQLLEPWFTGEHRLKGEQAPIFDLLMDTYLLLGNVRKRQRLLDKVIAQGDRSLRAAALQRKASILADKGDIRGAWDTFKLAQRELPGDPSLAMLELTLLVSQREIGKAKERARFWCARLRRDPDHNPEVLALLSEAAEDPLAVFLGSGRLQHPDLDTLVDMIARLPPAAVHHRIETTEIGATLTAEKALRQVEEKWLASFPEHVPYIDTEGQAEDIIWSRATDWLDILAKEPLAWQSFQVLDDVVMALDTVQVLGLDDTVYALLEYADRLLSRQLEAHEASGQVTLPWDFLENRPALRLLGRWAYVFPLESSPEACAHFRTVAERLLALNPQDNHGLRMDLSRVYLEEGSPEKVLALHSRFPNDLCTLALNHILALYQLDEQGKALIALQKVASVHKVAIKMLLAANPKPPALLPHGGYQRGGKDEAWIYRQEQLALWQQEGALDWLRGAWKVLK